MDYSNISGMELFGMPFCSLQPAGQASHTQPEAVARQSDQDVREPEHKATGQQAALEQPPAAPVKTVTEPEADRHEKEAPALHQDVTPLQPEKPAVPEQLADTDYAQEQKPPEKKAASSSAPIPVAAQPAPPEQTEKELVLDMSSDIPADGKLSEQSENEKRKAHEAAEAKRKAEWEAKQLAKKQAEKAEIQRLQSMSDEEAVSASTKRITDAVERITRRNMKECVSEHIQDLCRKDPAFARRTMHPRKSMVNCFRYINRQAKEYVKQEMADNDITPDNGGYGCDVPDGTVYQWAEDYFNDMDAPEDRQKEETFVPKPYAGTAPKTGKSASGKKGKKAKPKQKPENNGYEQLTLGV